MEVKGSNFGRWALTGGILAEAIVLAGAAAQGNLTNSDPEQAILWYGAAVVGAAVGGLAGAFTHHWTPIWTQPADWNAELAQQRGRSAPSPAVAGTTGRSPVAAMRIGLISTAAPCVLTVLFAGTENQKNLRFFSAIGAVGGPAVGLSSGGRGDLAVRGLWIRGLLGATWFGAAAVAENSKDEITVDVAKVVSVLGAAGLVVHAAHDLLITQSAVEQGRPQRVTFGVRSNGQLVLSTKF